MKRPRLAFALAALAVAAVALPGIYAVALQMDSDVNVARIGGTGAVRVLTPESDGVVNSVTFQLSNQPPYYVEAVNVTWEPAELGTYTVVVNLYWHDPVLNAPELLPNGSGTATVTVDGTNIVAGQATTTTVPLAGLVDPKDIDYVEVIIVQQSP